LSTRSSQCTLLHCILAQSSSVRDANQRLSSKNRAGRRCRRMST
jgi:hypothetical protein